MKRIILLLIGVVCCTSACVSGAEKDVKVDPINAYRNPRSIAAGPAYGNTDDDYLFGFSWGGLSEAYEKVPDMVSDACREFGIKKAIVGSPTSWNQEAQNHYIDELVSSGAKGILMMPSEPDAGGKKILELSGRGIPVVCIGGAPTQNSGNILTLAPDVYQYSYDATIALLDSLNYRGKIVVISGATTDSNSDKKIQAVKDVCNQYYHATLLETYKGIDSAESAEAIVNRILEMHGKELDGVVALDNFAAHVMATRFLENDDLQHIKCIGLDTDEVVLKAIEAGKMIGTMSQNPMAQAYLGVMTLKMIKDGWNYKEGQPDLVNTGNYLITKSNIDNYEQIGWKVTYEMANTWTDRFDPPVQERIKEKIQEKESNTNSHNRVSVIIPQSSCNYWDLMIEGIKENIPTDVSVIYEQSAEINDEVLLKQIETAVASNVDAIITYACDNEDFRKILQKAKYKGIDIILVESNISDNSNYCYVGINNYAAGEEAAKAMVIKRKGSGRISIIGGKEDLNSQRERIKGFKNVIKNFKNVEYICEEYSGANPVEANSLAQYILKTHPETTVFVVTSPSDVEAVKKVIYSRSNRDIYTIVTFDTESAINGEEKEPADVVIGLDPKSIGAAAADALMEALNSGTPSQSREIKYTTKIER